MPGVQPRVRTRQREQRRRGTTSPAGGAACSPLYRVTLRPDDLFLYLRWRATAYCVRHGVCHRECWYTRTDSSVQTVDGATPYYSTDEGPYQLVSGRVRTAVQQRVRSVSSVYARYTRQPVPNGSGRSPAHYHGAEATPTLPGCNHATAATRDRHGRGCCLGHGVFPRAEATARWRTNTPLQLSSCTQGTVRCGTQHITRGGQTLSNFRLHALPGLTVYQTVPGLTTGVDSSCTTRVVTTCHRLPGVPLRANTSWRGHGNSTRYTLLRALLLYGRRSATWQIRTRWADGAERT